MTERQAAAWPGAVAEAQLYVETSTVPLDLDDHYWRVRWDDEIRPGRGRTMWATWSDGEYFIEIWMDVYGSPRVAVASLIWMHNGSDEECDCEPCVDERESDSQ
ncbi:hypothetical protein E4V99_13965 [Microbacterium sp. dk485]|uniref:hypothetical protein n=1 Tax=Microbacterium sp. dk485 TaxID=2560021 RepID=UPI00107420C7|nr:hypothetical protein [Microbacterium sp. dk485]TFV82035.1 hypothetical protein E4V99_13965 [Microbacterium sp. dk485]